MGYYSRTNLRCSRPELIASGSTLNKKYNSNIIGCNGDAIHFLTRKFFLHEDILKLSEDNPDVTFTAITWNASEYYEQIVYTIIYSNGKYEEIGSKPNYQVSYPQLSEEATTYCNEFIDKILDFVENYPPHDLIPQMGNEDHNPSSQFRDNGLEAYLKFTWENEDHRFNAENKHWYLFEINYESKDQENLKRLRTEKDMLKKLRKSDSGNSKDQEYDVLPF